ncbi:MAG: co-chaperone GroES [Bacilli bacterium]|jgi:co-chaperonin GroES (HSP10)
MIKPTEEYLLLLSEKEEMASGLIVNTNENIGVIANVSEKEKFFKPGQKVVYKPNKAEEVYRGTEKYLLVKKEDVMAVFIDE